MEEKVDIIKYVDDIAKKYYDEKTYQHALRVAKYVAQDNTIPTEKLEMATVLAILHDLKEDTKWDGYIDEKLFPNINVQYMEFCLDLLTHNIKEEDYNSYIKKIRYSYYLYPEAYFVKKADIKDHLMLKDTLTNKLKEKYLDALRYFL